MSTPTSTPERTQTSSLPPTLLRNISIGAVIICPILLALPPRKLDIYTLLLLAGAGAGANQVSREFTGISIGERWMERMKELSNPLPEKALLVQAQLRKEKDAAMRKNGMPEKALEVQERLRREKEARGEVGGLPLGHGENAFKGLVRKAREAFGVEDKAEIEDAARKKAVLVEDEGEGEEGKGKRGMPKVLEKVWLGDEGKDWKKKRDQREREALEEGRGYGDLIMEQIWEVWNWGKDKAEEVKENDEKAVRERKEEREKRNGKK